MDTYHIVLLMLLPTAVSAAECSSGTIAGIVLGTFFATLLLVAVLLALAYVLWKKRNKAQHTKKVKSFENAAFQNDIEMQQNGTAGNNGLPAGYVECKEYERSNNNKVVMTKLENESETKAKRGLFQEFNSNHKPLHISMPANRAGSHSSLDGAATPNDPEVISVCLQSQDIIGLGFNVSGSLSEGIYVSQVHNRGPAGESGLVKVGDRILSITISMKNMVYEDALTILSYASPYSVRLRLQRPISMSEEKSFDTEEDNKVKHPVYRSQSMDDLSKINQDKWTGPRKTWSEIKRSHPAKGEEGKLRKWMNTDDIVHEEVGLNQSAIGDSKSSFSVISSDVQSEIADEVSSVQESITSNLKNASMKVMADVEKEMDVHLKRKSDSVEDGGVNDSGVVPDEPANKRSKDSLSEEDNTENYKQNEEITNPATTDGEATDKPAVLEVNVQQQVISGESNKHTFADINENKIELKDHVRGSGEVEKHEDTVRSVLKDYFGDQPNILEQFGFPEGSNGVNKDTKVEIHTEEKTENIEVSGGQNNRRRSKDYQYNTGTKGGMAYYLRFDDNFYDDFGLFNHEFSTQKEQPNLVPVPINDVLSTSTKPDNSGRNSADLVADSNA